MLKKPVAMETTFRIYEPRRRVAFKIIRIIILFLACCCCACLIIICQKDISFEGHATRLCFIAVGAYIIILAIDVITEIYGQPIPMQPMLAFMIVGAVLFITAGTLTVLKFIDVLEKHFNVLLLLIFLFCFIIAILMASDVIAMFLDCKRCTKKSLEYRFDPVCRSLENGDVILQLVNPHPKKNKAKSESKPVTPTKSGSKPVTPIKSNSRPVSPKTAKSEQLLSPTQKTIQMKPSQKLEYKPNIDKDIMARAGRLLNKKSEDIIVKDVKTADLKLTDSTDITPLKNNFYLVKQRRNKSQ